MSPNVSDARELVAEGDRLLGRAWEHFPRSRASVSPADLGVAEHYYSDAARMYLAAAAEYQGCDDAIDVFAAGSADLLSTLDGQLRAESEAAWAEASLSAADATDRALECARSFAEGLRDRFSHALPELFPTASAPADRAVSQPMER
jgi:hypothetical protein